MSETIIAKGKLFELVQHLQPDGRVFEVARRAPGVRLIIYDKDEKKVLLTKEYRNELQAWDFRLPGGKLFDTLDEYEAHRQSGDDTIEAAKRQAKREAQQEVGVDVARLTLYKKSILGATVEWDLYVFETYNWHVKTEGQNLEVGEKIEADTWFTYDEVRIMILNGALQEERIALVLLQWLGEQI